MQVPLSAQQSEGEQPQITDGPAQGCPRCPAPSTEQKGLGTSLTTTQMRNLRENLGPESQNSLVP